MRFLTVLQCRASFYALSTKARRKPVKSKGKSPCQPHDGLPAAAELNIPTSSIIPLLPSCLPPLALHKTVGLLEGKAGRFWVLLRRRIGQGQGPERRTFEWNTRVLAPGAGRGDRGGHSLFLQHGRGYVVSAGQNVFMQATPRDIFYVLLSFPANQGSHHLWPSLLLCLPRLKVF